MNSRLSEATRIKWTLSSDSHYQMSNRFATACKLTEMGYSVILVYLGFLGAEEMRNQGAPIASAADWERQVFEHSKPLFPEVVWNQPHSVNGQWIIPLIRSTEIDYDQPVGTFIVT